ncbi:MAG TPA: hypothetical protein VE075_01780 [Thermoanaerobaculia bacterium]|nr:hypothetical protein [Thermoanaerobaculia bacterium]
MTAPPAGRPAASSPGAAHRPEHSWLDAARESGQAPSAAGEAWRLAVAFVAYAVLAALYLRPIWSVFSTHIAPDLGDPLFNLYILKWVAHEAHRGFAGFWNAPFFFPARSVLAYSDHLLGPGLAATAFSSLVPEGRPHWIPAYNLLLLSSFALTGLAACFVLRRSRIGWAAAWLGGAMYAFSPFRWDQLSHLQILLMQLIPVTLWSFDHLLARPGRRRAVLFLACYLLHLSGGCYLALMIHVPLAVLFANRLPELRRSGRWRAELPVLGGTALIAAAAAGALFGEYRAVARSASLHWGPNVLRTWGASIVSYLTPSPLNLYTRILPAPLHRPESSLFPGWLAAGLALLGACDLWRRHRQSAAGEAPPAAGGKLPARRRAVLAALPVLAGVGWLAGEARTWSIRAPGVFQLTGLPRWATRNYSVPLLLLAVGAGGWLWLRRRWGLARPVRWREIDPWPRGLLAAGAATAALSFPILFDPASRLLPGLAAIRVPARFDAFTSLAIVWLAATALDARVRGRPPVLRRRGAAIATAAAALLLLELCPRPVSWVEIEDEDDFPDVTAWIADQPDVQAVLEIPLADPSLSYSGLVNVYYMYYGTLHWKPLVNGYSAHAPVTWEWLQQHCCWPLPDAATLAQLRIWGVTHLVIHRSEMPGEQRRELDRWEAGGQAQLLYAGGGDRVYRIRPGPEH